MNILLIGSGGREHALALALKRSGDDIQIYANPGNPGIFTYAEYADFDIKDFDAIAKYCKKSKIDLVVIGPEQFLSDGLADVLRAQKIDVFGPSQEASRLESSKVFSKEFMITNNIPTAKYKSFNQKEKKEAIKYLNTCSMPIVIKADGLAAGKGVIVADTLEVAEATINSMFDGKFGKAGSSIIIEEFMVGEEASILAITDGTDYITLAPSQDHKRIFENDKGPNTGGMGVYAPAPVVDNIVLEKVQKEIIEPTLEACKKMGHPFIGCLYVGLMINNNEPKVVEFNVRFGDPETEAVLPLVEGNFAGLLKSAAKGKMKKDLIELNTEHSTCTVILASEGYPGEFEKGFEIDGIIAAEKKGAFVYHSGTAMVDDKLVTNGGRVLAVTCVGEDLQTAIKHVYQRVEKINFKNKYYRKDIGKKGLKYYY
jgi:phosphoribosylamine--glycine ligase